MLTSSSCAWSRCCPLASIAGLQSTVHHNLPYPQVFEHETKNKEGESTANGTFCVSTGQFTGRSPKDKYFVQQVCAPNTVLPEGILYYCGTRNRHNPGSIFDACLRQTMGLQGASIRLYLSEDVSHVQLSLTTKTRCSLKPPVRKMGCANSPTAAVVSHKTSV